MAFVDELWDGQRDKRIFSSLFLVAAFRDDDGLPHGTDGQRHRFDDKL